MTIAQETELRPEIIFPPSDIYSDEPPLETELHLRQIIALWQSIEWLWQTRNEFYVAGNLTIYYSPNQRKSEDFSGKCGLPYGLTKGQGVSPSGAIFQDKGPDLFIVLGTERKPRKSWVVWAGNTLTSL